MSTARQWVFFFFELCEKMDSEDQFVLSNNVEQRNSSIWKMDTHSSFTSQRSDEKPRVG